VFQKKLEGIKNYYLSKIHNTNLDNAFREEIEKFDDSGFMELSQQCLKLYSLDNFTNLKNLYQHIIFEGSQGIMLDQEHGIFPHVTRSSTTSQNALEVLENASVTASQIDLYYVTRCYQTRHGNGPMSNDKSVKLENNETEMNQNNQYQGAFRVAKLDVELLKYALSCDLIYHNSQNINKILVITCLDQRPDFDLESILTQLKNCFQKVYLNFSPEAKFIDSNLNDTKTIKKSHFY
jgi:adenylosuccinate synthase